MIRQVLEILKINDFYGIDPIIDIAKGIYKAPENIKEFKESVKRRANG